MAKINKAWVDSTILTEDLYDANNGVAQLDGSGKIKTAQLPTSVQQYLGAWNANTNSPTLADGVGTAGDTYRVSVAGSQDLGSGTIAFGVGDLVIYNGSVWEVTPQDSSFTGKTTDDLNQGVTNLYYDADLVQDAVMDDYVVGPDSAVANTDSVREAVGKLQGQLNASPSAITFAEEVATLDATDISNGYYDLANSPIAASLTVIPDDGPVQRVGSDYTLSTNRVTFAGDLASTLVDGSVVIFKYAF
jgi:hypothetical protein